MDLWPITLDARRSLLATFEGLDSDQWEVESLCAGWTVRQVLAHLVLAARPPARRYVPAMIRARGSFDEANRALAVADAAAPPSELIERYREVIDHRFSPPGWPAAAPLADILLHSLDVRVPLGLPSDEPPVHYEPVLGLLFDRVGRSFGRSGRPEVRWVATDHEWAAGAGAEVRGAMADLALTAAGRSARLDRLEGDGVPEVRAWLVGPG